MTEKEKYQLKIIKYLKEADDRLKDKLYKSLIKVPEFKNLAMDRQGEIVNVIVKEMKR